MSSISPRHTLLALTLAALIGLPSLAAAAPRPQRAAPREVHPGRTANAWTFLRHFCGFEGMMIDPNG